MLQEMFDDIIKEKVLQMETPIDEDGVSDLVEKSINSVLPKITKLFLDTLKQNAPEMLLERRGLSSQFVVRNIDRWSRAFDLLETQIVMCTEAGENFNKSYRSTAVQKQDIVFDTLVRIHARACHISSEILCLLKNGYADGAHARWRALHEVVCVGLFIFKHGKEAATRFVKHEIIDSYKAMVQYNKYESRLNVDPFSEEEIYECKARRDMLIEEYGDQFKDPYGWATPFFNKPSTRFKPNFTDIEKNIELDHMRPYYKWACQNIHVNIKSLKDKLGLCEAQEELLLVGQSNSGMTDPAHSAAISLSQITITLLNVEPTIDELINQQAIISITDEVGQAFLGVSNNKEKS